MQKYKYKRPAGDLYIVSQRDWNKTFAKRGRWPFTHVEVYISPEDRFAYCQYTFNWLGKLLLIVGYPVFFLYGMWVQGSEETYQDLKRSIWQKKYGSFSSDAVYRNTDGWNKLMDLIGK